MSSFQRLWENIQSQKDKTPQDDRAMSVIRTGLGIRDEFWDDFSSERITARSSIILF